MLDIKKLAKNVVDELLYSSTTWAKPRVVQPDQWENYADVEFDIKRMYDIAYKAIQDSLGIKV